MCWFETSVAKLLKKPIKLITPGDEWTVIKDKTMNAVNLLLACYP